MIPTGQFDIASTKLQAVPFTVYDDLHRGPSVFRNSDNSVAIVGHAPATVALANRDTVRKCPERVLRTFPPGHFRDHNAHTMTFMDPPDHGRVRGAMASAFTPRALNKLAELVETVANANLSTIADDHDDGFDLIEAFARPLPLAIIAAILGLSIDDATRLGEGAAHVVAALEPTASAETIGTAETALAVMTRFMTERIGTPAPGLSADEAVHQAIFLFNAGHETTTTAIAQAARLLIEDADARAALAGGTAQWDTAVDEALRLQPPLHMIFRRTIAPLALGPHVVAPHMNLVIVLAAANRDPTVFCNPAHFDVTRANSRCHLSFATGRHTCLGATLARIETKVALRLLFDTFPDLALAGPAESCGGPVFHGLRKMPVRRGGPRR